MDNKAHEPQAKESRGFFHRLFGPGKHESASGHETSLAKNTKRALDLGDIQGFILRGYRMPMVRHFLLTVGIASEARRILGRLVNDDESDAPQITTAKEWHVGFEPGPEDKLDDVPRRKPIIA